MTAKRKWLRTALSTAIAASVMGAMSVSAYAQSLLRDTEIEETLQHYSTPIFRAAGLNTENVDLYIVNDDSLNAFVTRGQKVFLHTGLISESENPNQLKGVIAHEAGHIAGGHLARSDYGTRSAYGAMLLAAGVGLAAILAGEGSAGALILGGSTQFGTLEYLSYTRTNESAADQYAAQYMERTGQSGQGLIDFFNKFRYQEVLSQAKRYPYFRSHPLSSARIDALREVVEESPYSDTIDSDDDMHRLVMMQAKLSGFLDAPQIVFSKYPAEDISAPARYARAVAHFRSASLKSALREIDALIEAEPENPYYYELKAQILFESGRGKQSIEPIRKAIELKPDSPLFHMALGVALIEQQTPEALDEAVTSLKTTLQAERENVGAWIYLASAQEALGQNGLAEYATAEARFILGKYREAQAFAHRAQKDLPRNSPQWRRASDIIVIAETQLAKEKRRR